MIPVHVLWRPGELLPDAGEIDEAPGIDEEVGAPQDLDHGICPVNDIRTEKTEHPQFV